MVQNLLHNGSINSDLFNPRFYESCHTDGNDRDCQIIPGV